MERLFCSDSIAHFVKFASTYSIFFIAMKELAQFLLKILSLWLHGLTCNRGNCLLNTKKAMSLSIKSKLCMDFTQSVFFIHFSMFCKSKKNSHILLIGFAISSTPLSYLILLSIAHDLISKSVYLL